MAQHAPRSRGTAWALGVLLALGLAVRLSHLGRGLWFDEIETLVEYVRLPLSRIVADYHSSNQHPLYSVLARLSVDLLGESGWALRLPAALLGTASLWAYYRLAAVVSDRREALVGAALLTFSYHHVWFSQNARGYSGLLLLSLLATLAFLRLLQDPEAGWGAVAVYALSAALAVYVHPTAVLVAVSHALVFAAVCWSRRRGADARSLRPAAGILGAACLTLLLYAPMLSQVIATLRGPAPQAARTAWQSPLWMLGETARGLAAGLPGGWVALLAASLVMVAGALSFWRQSPAVTGLLILPGLLTVVTLLAGHQNMWPRFFFFSAGFALLIAVRGGYVLCRLALGERGPVLAASGAILAIVASAFTIPRAWGPKQDFLGAERFVDQVRSPDDAVVTIDLTEYPYRRWRGRDWPVAESAADLMALEATHRRTWLLYTFPVRLAVVHPDIWQRIADRYRTAAVFPGTVGGGAVVVTVSPSTPPAP